MDHIPYTSGLSPMREVEIALQAASDVVLQIAYVGGCLAVAAMFGLLVAELFVRARRKNRADAKNADQDVGNG